MSRRLLYLALALLGPPGIAAAQTKPVAAPGGFVPQSSLAFGAPGSPATSVTPATPLPVAGRAEAFRLATANVPSSAATLFGGNYVFTQGCSTYGTVTLRYLGPDGVTMVTTLTRNAADSGGGTMVTVGASAIVDVTLAGTTGCNVTLARIP